MKACCYNGDVLPCHIRFWFVMVNWIGIFFTLLDKVIQHDYIDLEDKLGDRETLAIVQDCSYILKQFTEKAGTAWGVIILLQAYLAPDMMGYISTLIDSSVCVFMFNVSFSSQLFFVTLCVRNAKFKN